MCSASERLQIALARRYSQVYTPMMDAKKGLPTMFVGSSAEGLKVAEALSEKLKESAEVTIWNEGVFNLNRGTLEELINAVQEFDFAALVLTPDDMVDSRGNSKSAPRDNVLFESGLFIGHLGRDRTFIVYDSTGDLKIPSDLAGATLATYEGERMASNPQAAVRGACARINRAISKSGYRQAFQLMGDWRSRYNLTISDDIHAVEEDVEIRPSAGKVCIKSINNPEEDHYLARGVLVRDRHLVGDWNSIRPTANAFGAFVLTIHPWGNLLYGFFVGPDKYNRIVHSTWVLARKNGDKEVGKLLEEGESMLKETSAFWQIKHPA